MEWAGLGDCGEGGWAWGEVSGRKEHEWIADGVMMMVVVMMMADGGGGCCMRMWMWW